MQRTQQTLFLKSKEQSLEVEIKRELLCWLLPIIIFLVIFGGLIVLTQGSAVAPFIYAIF